MSSPTRAQVTEALANALFSATLADGVTSAFVTSYPRLVSWDNISPSNQPAICLARMQDRRIQQPPQGLKSKLFMYYAAVVYVYTADLSITPSEQLDTCLDAIDRALQPDDLNRNVFTLGGLVYRCWVEGTTDIAPGDEDHQGMAVVPIVVLVP